MKRLTHEPADPVALLEQNPQTGQLLSEFDQVFPLLWEPS